jgi:hypothetical protein
MTPLLELEQSARAATPGPWFVDEDPRHGMSWNRSIDTDDGHGHTVCFMTHSDGKFPERDKATAEHIANCDPQTILALVEVAKAAKALAEGMAPLGAEERELFWNLRRALTVFKE